MGSSTIGKVVSVTQIYNNEYMKDLIEKQNRVLVNTLIQIASTSVKQSTVPISKSGKKTEAILLYEVLINNPYRFKQNELFAEVYFKIKQKPHLKIETYMMQRSELCSLFGWGIHGDEEGRLALVPSESDMYKVLFAKPFIIKKKAFNKHKK